MFFACLHKATPRALDTQCRPTSRPRAAETKEASVMDGETHRSVCLDTGLFVVTFGWSQANQDKVATLTGHLHVET